ncbi:unnamed protein product [Closterium sp. Naga37s-1]|nr:unnamed protein product [Closterium sp. Naga37s-1]
MADHPDAIERPDDPGDEPAHRSPIDLSAAVTGLDLLFSNLAAVDNHGKAPAVAPTVDVPFEPIDEPLCPSPTAPVLEQDSSNPSGEEIAAVPVAKKSARYTQSTLPWPKKGGPAGYAGPCGRGGKGATDVQTQAFKRHAATTKHKEALKHQQKLLDDVATQPRINGDNLARDTEKERVVKLLDSLLFVTKQDAPIELWVNLVRYLARLKGSTTSAGSPAGDAILRAVEVFPALIVMLYEWDITLYELATSYRFHFLLYFLADVLEQLNVLNRAFQQRELDIASVHGQIRRSISFLESRYVDCGDDFGGGVSARLSPFIKKHGPEGGNPEVKVQGVDSDGRPTTHTFELHEKPSEDYPTLGSHDACVDLCTTFAETLVQNLSTRFQDLDSLVGVRLFMPDEWELGRAERHRQCLEWLESLVRLFRAQDTDYIIPGVDKRRAIKELRAFCPILAVSFHSSLRRASLHSISVLIASLLLGSATAAAASRSAEPSARVRAAASRAHHAAAARSLTFPSPIAPPLVAMARGPRSALQAGLATALAAVVALALLTAASVDAVCDSMVSFEDQYLLIRNCVCEDVDRSVFADGSNVNAQIDWQGMLGAERRCSSISFHSAPGCGASPYETILRPPPDWAVLDFASSQW